LCEFIEAVKAQKQGLLSYDVPLEQTDGVCSVTIVLEIFLIEQPLMATWLDMGGDNLAGELSLPGTGALSALVGPRRIYGTAHCESSRAYAPSSGCGIRNQRDKRR